jgi:hypothetical protein
MQALEEPEAAALVAIQDWLAQLDHLILEEVEVRVVWRMTA